MVSEDIRPLAPTFSPRAEISLKRAIIRQAEQEEGIYTYKSNICHSNNNNYTKQRKNVVLQKDHNSRLNK